MYRVTSPSAATGSPVAVRTLSSARTIVGRHKSRRKQVVGVLIFIVVFVLSPGVGVVGGPDANGMLFRESVKRTTANSPGVHSWVP